jgi:hypothetical protein
MVPPFQLNYGGRRCEKLVGYSIYRLHMAQSSRAREENPCGSAAKVAFFELEISRFFLLLAKVI